MSETIDPESPYSRIAWQAYADYWREKCNKYMDWDEWTKTISQTRMEYWYNQSDNRVPDDLTYDEWTMLDQWFDEYYDVLPCPFHTFPTWHEWIQLTPAQRYDIRKAKREFDERAPACEPYNTKTPAMLAHDKAWIDIANTFNNSKEDNTMKNAATIEDKTYVNGMNVNDLDDGALITVIEKQREHIEAIRSLEGLGSKRIENLTREAEATLQRLVELLDAKS